MRRKSFEIAGVTISPGEHKALELPAASLYTQTPMNIPIQVFHGKYTGPRLFVMAALHGDEVNGVEIVRLLLSERYLKELHGTLIVIPVANVFGFIHLSRYLPDRRDLNRSFPGSKTGSLAARIANVIMEEVISRCTHGIDLHTGHAHSDNLPQIRSNLEVPGALWLAKAFNVPIILDAKIRDGSLRQAATEANIPIIVYEGGEGLRFNELAIQAGLRGVLNVLHALKMIKQIRMIRSTPIKSQVARGSGWIRSPESGIVHSFKALGAYVQKGEELGIIADPFARTSETPIESPVSGIIIGKNTLPLINEGDALFHVAQIKGGKRVTAQFQQLESDLYERPLVLF